MKNEFQQGLVLGSLICILLIGLPSVFFVGKFTSINDAIQWQITANEYKKTSEELIKQVESLRSSDLICETEKKPMKVGRK